MTDLTVEGLVDAFDRMTQVQRVLRERRRRGALLDVIAHRRRPPLSRPRNRIEWLDPDAVEAWIRRGPR